MWAVPHVVNVTTDGSGGAVVYSDRTLQGKVIRVVYTKDDFTNGVDFTITTEKSGQTIWKEIDVNAAKSVNPTQTLQDNVGADVTYDGTRIVHGPIFLANERIKVVIASGGAAKNGKFTFYVGG